MGLESFKRTGDGDFSQYIKGLISGPPKSGKTSLLGTVPGILVLDTEPHANNLESIRHLNVPYRTVYSLEDVRDVLLILGNPTLRAQLAQMYGLADITGVAIDTLDTLQKIMKKERMADQRSKTFERDDWGWLKTEMEAIIEGFTALPMHVFFTVHTKTQEMGKGKDAYTQAMPGLEGAIAGTIAGMVGYSMLSFREEELQPDGTTKTVYKLRTEGDRTYDFLGTRTAGRLPSVIEPNIKVIYDAIMEGRQAQEAATQPPPMQVPPTPNPVQDQAVANSGLLEANGVPPQAPAQEVAQTPRQAPEVQTPVDTSQQAPAGSAPPAADAKPADDEPINPAAMTHVKKIYDALEVSFPTEIVEKLTIGKAREMAKYWKAIQLDHAEGKAAQGTTPQGEMLAYLTGQGLVAAAAETPAPVEEKPFDINSATVDEMKAYIGNPPNLERVQEVYDLELAKPTPRKGLITKLESFGAKPPPTPVEPTPDTGPPDPPAQVQTPVENPAPPAPEEPVTQPAPAADDSSAEVALLQDQLGAEVVSEDINASAKCEVCGNEIDDVALAELAKRLYSKVLCVKDYLAEQKK